MKAFLFGFSAGTAFIAAVVMILKLCKVMGDEAWIIWCIGMGIWLITFIIAQIVKDY